MHVAVYLPLLVAALLGASGPALARRLPPATATRLLVAAGALIAAATSFVLVVLAFTLVAQFWPVDAFGPWSVPALAAADPVPRPAGAVATAMVVVLAGTGIRAVALRARALLAARALCLHLGGGPGQLVVVDDGDDVFAVPAARGRIVASRRLLQALAPSERHAVLAHEAAHLRHHHYGYRLAADLAAAVNPLLVPLARGVRYATERWADETAARVTGDRKTVARALARASLYAQNRRWRAAWSGATMRTTGSQVIPRVRALLAPAPRQRPGIVFAVAALLAITVAASVEAKQDTERLFERSMAATTATAGDAGTTSGVAVSVTPMAQH